MLSEEEKSSSFSGRSFHGRHWPGIGDVRTAAGEDTDDWATGGAEADMGVELRRPEGSLTLIDPIESGLVSSETGGLSKFSSL